MVSDVMKEFELSDDFLNFVSGGVYSQEEWAAMSYEERKQAWIVSLTNRANGVWCQLDPEPENTEENGNV